WTPISPTRPTDRPRWAVLGAGDDLGVAGEHRFSGVTAARTSDMGFSALLAPLVRPPGGAVATAAQHTTRQVLALAQSWLADDRSSVVPLVVVTRGAEATGTAGRRGVTDLVAAPIWGLLRSVQSELPGLVVLVDLDEDPPSPAALSAAL